MHQIHSIQMTHDTSVLSHDQTATTAKNPYSKLVPKPRDREGCGRKGICISRCMAGLTFALIFVAAAGQLVVI